MKTSDWQNRLSPHAARMADAHLRELIAADPARAQTMAIRVGAIHASFGRQKYDHDAWQTLLALAEARALPARIAALFDGAIVNISEQRPALHTALRSDLGESDLARRSHREARAARLRMAELLAELEASPITDIINVGIGGSDLGPRLVADALAGQGPGRFRVHFLANVDGHAAQRILAGLDPARTAAILVSKSFGTQETLLNGRLIRDWLGGPERLYAVSANLDRAAGFGIPADRLLPMWDWVGGRYSLWSAVGFSAALAIGMTGFDRLLAGAASLDAHVRHSPLEGNLAVRHALTAIWNRNGLGFDGQLILPYDERLALLPAYLQQLVMESLGKSVQEDGSAVGWATTPALWGGTGTSSQHSFFQALHQGTDRLPAEFIAVARADHPHRDNHRVLLAHALAQAQSLALGEDNPDPHRRYPGDRPSTLILLDALTPESLGALIALYEHSVYLQGVLWGIDPFDQWGVELGKRIADSLLPAVSDPQRHVSDPVTAAVLAELHRHPPHSPP
ncbi:MAG TPA: glucose-6-phosphate isomerase [Xanthomonadales bacterium]|nr:glucose-6-phosphate isomerase [Xanthomonadales bacterium]